MDSGQTKLAMTISTLGWLLLVIAVGLFFWLGKPHYYQQGVDDQLERDILVIDQFLNGSLSPVAPFLGQIVEISPTEIILNVDSITPNPLVAEEDQQKRTFMISDTTSVVVLDYIDPVEYENKVQDAIALQGGQDGFTPPSPFVEEQFPYEELIVGDFVSITPEPNQARTDKTLRAGTISKSTFSDSSGQPFDPNATQVGNQPRPNNPPYDPGPPQDFDLTPVSAE